jgi:LuxR family transcriptional regulator, maltose regulon positive regulatory protein
MDRRQGEHVPMSGSGLPSGKSEKDPLSPEQRTNLLRTKFFVPPIRSNQIARPRLMDLMNASLDKALTLVSAPAGYGKTTLVSRWLVETRIPSVWLSLNEADNDPLRFLQYLFGALLPIAPAIEDHLLGMLQGIQPAQFETLLSLLVNALASNPVPFVLVLDDFHVIQSQPVLEILTFLLQHIPRPMHLVLVTRTDPPLPLARLRAGSQLMEIRAGSLRFTNAEIVVFLNESMGLKLSAGDIAALEARTEGWIAGLQLAALSMQGCPDRHAFISAFTGSHHYVMDYLVQEVLRRQPKQVSTFLLQSAILDHLCAPLCEAVVEAGPLEPVDGQALLETLEQMNLFVIPLDDKRCWYRYHHLFADVLNQRLEQQFPHLLPELHHRASQWYEQNGLISEAIQHSLLAGDKDRAARLIDQNGCNLLISGEGTTLLNWIKAIESQLETHPWLAIQKAWALAITGDLGRVEPTLQPPQQQISSLEPTLEVKTMQGTIAAARAYCANTRGNTRSAAEYAQQALDLLPDCSAISCSIRSVVTSILGDASWINGHLEEALHAYTEAIRIGREAENLHMVILANSNLGDLLMEQGQLQRAANTYLQSLNMAVRPDGQRSPLAGPIYLGLGRLAYACNRLENAHQSIHQCVDLCRQWGDLDCQAAAFAMLARLEQALGHPEKAIEAARVAEQLADEVHLSPRRSILLKSDLARFWLAQGHLQQTSQLLQKGGLTLEAEIPYQQAPEYLILVRVLLARGDFEAALTLSERLLQQAETAGRVELALEILVLRSLAFQGIKEPQRALGALERAISLAQPEGYIRVFLDEGEPMTRLLCHLQSRQVGSGYPSELLSIIGTTSGKTQPSMQLLIEPLTPRELEVLQLIETGCSNQEISEKLFISIPTVKRHISNIYAKLGVQSRTQAIAIGKELKLFE